MFITIGIDASLTGTGVVCLKGDTIASSQRLDTKLKGVERLVAIEERLKHFVNHFNPDLVLLEGYAYAAKNQAHQIGELGGVIRTMLHKHNINWIEVAPPQVKKFATGKGNAQKDLVMLNVYKKWGAEFVSNDEADAYVLAKIGQALGEYKFSGEYEAHKKGEVQKQYSQYQIEVLDVLREKYKRN